MQNNITQKDQINLFKEVVKISLNTNDNTKRGELIFNLLQENNAFEWYKKIVKPTTFTAEEVQVIHAINENWKFYRIDGVTFYWLNDIIDGNGPFVISNQGKNLRIVSSRLINKMKNYGGFPKNYSFYSSYEPNLK
jgi:hypothetical protein